MWIIRKLCWRSRFELNKRQRIKAQGKRIKDLERKDGILERWKNGNEKGTMEGWNIGIMEK